MGLALLLLTIILLTPVSYKAKFEGKKTDFIVKIMFGLVTVKQDENGEIITKILFIKKRGRKNTDDGEVDKLP